MAVKRADSAVRRNHWLFVLIAALFLCLVTAVLLVSRINDARSNMAQASPGAFNYLLQNSRNIDAFIDSLRQVQLQRNNYPELSKQYRQQFDVLWGGFSIFEINYNVRPSQQQTVDDLIASATDYLTSNDHRMAADYVLSDAEIDSLVVGANALTDKIVHISHEYFIYASHLRDIWNEKLARLYQMFWACVVLLGLTGGLLLGLLIRSIRRSAELIDKSHKTQREMKRLIDELRSGRLESKAKDSFIAAASHDLRQPLHALGLFLGATEKHIENDAGKQALAEAKHCTAELNRLFNSLLDLSRLDAGVVEANKTEFKLDRFLALMEQEFSAAAKHAGIYFSVAHDPLIVTTDALLLNRILRNLLENAFSHSGATDVQIFCEQQGDRVRLTVADNGTGIPVSEQSDIFSEYYQLENPERDRSKGLGLGLSIVKRLCEIMDVDVSLESEVGVGTMFHLDLPAGKNHTTLVRSPAATLITPPQAPESVLVAVIDDDANVRRGMVSILESLNFHAVAAESAVEMIRILRLRELNPDILIADYRLRKNQTGDVAIHQIRAAFGIDFPAMIITGDTSPSRVSEAANSGFELIHKPVEPAELVHCINTVLESESAPMAKAR